MSLSVTFNIPINIFVQGGQGQVMLPLAVGVSIGEPKIVTHQPQPIFLDTEKSSRERWERDNPLPRSINQRTCAKQPEPEPVEPVSTLKSFNEINNVVLERGFDVKSNQTSHCHET